MLADDWQYCREVLPRVSRTFALNIRLLSGSMAGAVCIGYLLCRICDALEDSWPGSPAEIHGRFEWLRQAIAGDEHAVSRLAEGARPGAAAREDLALVTQLDRVLRCYGSLETADREAIRECLGAMSSGMSRFAERAAQRPTGTAYLESEAELHEYCWAVAGCVGVMLTRLFNRRAADRKPERAVARMAEAAAVGEALQLTNIILDWPSDIRRGCCFVPGEWLRELGLAPADLVGAPRPEQRVLLDRLELLAREALARVPEYLDAVPLRSVRYRLFCLWPSLWAAASLRHARRDPGFPWAAERPRLPRSRLWSIALGTLLTAHHPRSLRWYSRDLVVSAPHSAPL
jgi:farnesyl-diphosphate farnesyltransferase